MIVLQLSGRFVRRQSRFQPGHRIITQRILRGQLPYSHNGRSIGLVLGVLTIIAVKGVQSTHDAETNKRPEGRTSPVTGAERKRSANQHDLPLDRTFVNGAITLPPYSLPPAGARWMPAAPASRLSRQLGSVSWPRPPSSKLRTHQPIGTAHM